VELAVDRYGNMGVVAHLWHLSVSASRAVTAHSVMK
jgi:hypothetical protein